MNDHVSVLNLGRRSRLRTGLLAMRVSLVTLGAVLIVSVPVAAMADPALDACKRQVFQQADVNSDGMLSLTEAADDPLHLGQPVFGMADANQDGVLDREEYDDLGFFASCEMCPGVSDCAGA